MTAPDHGATAVAALQAVVDGGSEDLVYKNPDALYGIGKPGPWAGEIGALLQRLPYQHRIEIRRAAREVAKAADQPDRSARSNREPLTPDPEVSEVYLGPQVDEVAAQGVRALSRLPDLFTRAGRLIRVADGRMIDLTPSSLVTQLSRAAAWWAMRAGEGGGEWVQVSPPRSIASSIADAGDYPGVRQIAGITTVPQLQPDGSVACVSGFDPASRLWYAGTDLDVPDAPTRDDAMVALRRLLALVEHFPFKGEHHRSAWVALGLTLVMRPLIDGPVPMFVASANQARLGKTRLIKAAVWLATGSRPAMSTLQTYSEEEWDKAVSSLILGANPDAVCIDNVPRGDNRNRDAGIGCATLDAVLTADGPVQIRRFGTSDMPRVETRTVWTATSNGATFRGDTRLRSVLIELDFPGTEPEAREFGPVSFEARIEAGLGQLRADLLTLARAWLLAGRPGQQVRPWGSFEAWGVVRQVCVWLGLSDPREASGAVPGGDDDRDAAASELDRLVALLVTCFGPKEWTSSDLARLIDGERPDGTRLTSGLGLGPGWSLGDAQDLFSELGCWDRTASRVDRKALAYRLRGSKDRPDSAGRRLRQTGRDPRTRNVTFQLHGLKE